MQALLEFRDIVRTLQQGEYQIRVGGCLNESEILLIEGPSGSGKSTLLRILARLLQPDSGSLLLQGRESGQISPVEWRRRIKYVPQRPVIFPGSLEDNLVLPYRLAEVARRQKYRPDLARELMEALGLEARILSQDAGKLSGGEAARMSLLRSIMLEPEILLLDEPTAYLDADSRRRVLDLAREWVQAAPGRGLVLVSHSQEDLAHLPYLRRLVIQGRKAAG